VHSLCLQRWFARAAEGSRVVTLDNFEFAGGLRADFDRYRRVSLFPAWLEFYPIAFIT
jgi:hypothetical protein